MHELGVMIEVVKTVEDFAEKNNLSKIGALVLQIGELSSMIPHYIEACFPAAADGTLLQDAELRIEVLPGNARCRACGSVYRLSEYKGKCPKCAADRFEVLSGKEFLIKEIVAC